MTSTFEVYEQIAVAGTAFIELIALIMGAIIGEIIYRLTKEA